MHNTGDRELQRDVVAIVEHVLSDRPGDWRVVIAGSQDSDQWELKIFGPNAFERSYTLEGATGQHKREIWDADFAMLRGRKAARGRLFRPMVPALAEGARIVTGRRPPRSSPVPIPLG
jgi:hypothetical protein